jgi:hypothetical protein
MLLFGVVVRVCVVRKWNFRGMADSGPIQHVDMVLADEKVCLVHSRQPLLLKPNHNTTRVIFLMLSEKKHMI